MSKIYMLICCIGFSMLAGCLQQSDSAAPGEKEKTEVMGTGKDIALPKQSDYKKEP